MTSDTLTEVMPHHSEVYEPGAILEFSWGYDQTNIDYFMVVTRSQKNGTVWLTLVSMTVGTREETGFMQGHCTPGEPTGDKPFRRKLHVDNGRESGVRIESYGWCSLWDGKPSRWSSYA